MGDSPFPMKLRPILLPAFRGIFAAAGLSVAAFVARADIVTDWNAAMTSYAATLSPAPFVETRVYAMAHLALLGAVVEAKSTHLHNPAHQGPAVAEAAGARAAHDVLVHEFPGGTAAFDTLLATQLAAIPNGPGKTLGVAIGAAAAADMLASRANDGSASPTAPYTPGTNPGDYQPTPPFDGPPFNGFVDAVNWGKVTPFALTRGNQFRVPPPYKVTDLNYTFDFTEIKALGAQASSARTSDQTNIAIFWAESGGLGWNRIARLLADRSPRDLLATAQLFANLNAALADGYIAAFDSKFAYNFWRPITAIRRAANDGNALTVADPAWLPLLTTPPVPDYPSAHATVGAAAATVLIAAFGDNQAFTLSSTMSAPFPFVGPRTFTSLSDAAKENALSRMLLGIHFRLACEIGLEQGVDVGTWVVQHPPNGKSH